MKRIVHADYNTPTHNISVYSTEGMRGYELIITDKSGSIVGYDTPSKKSDAVAMAHGAWIALRKI